MNILKDILGANVLNIFTSNVGWFLIENTINCLVKKVFVSTVYLFSIDLVQRNRNEMK